jgi:hypothetical protein
MTARRLLQALTRRLRRTGGDDRGSITVWIVTTTPLVGLLITVLLVDGGAKQKAEEQAASYSAEAARAASLAVGPQGSGGPADTRAAVTAANNYLSAAGVRGVTTVIGPGIVQVSVTVHRAAPISGHTFTVTRSATARLLVGVETGQAP